MLGPGGDAVAAPQRAVAAVESRGAELAPPRPLLTVADEMAQLVLDALIGPGKMGSTEVAHRHPELAGPILQAAEARDGPAQLGLAAGMDDGER
jgi:hypothetical protein